MLVYTITANVDKSVAEEWLTWVKENFITAIMQTKLFEKYHVFRVLNDNDGDTITFQFFCKDIIAFKQFQDEYKAPIVASLTNSFPNKVVFFNTLLQQLDI